MTRGIIKAKAFKNQSIRITMHAKKRWRERVSYDENTTKSEIREYIKECAIKNKIEHYWDKFYIVDNDIVVRADVDKVNTSHNAIEEEGIVIITVFGRISDNPCLNNIAGLVKYKSKYGKMIYDRRER